MRVPKLLKVAAITVTTVVILLLLSVAIFVFNPFEGSLPDLRFAVPRGVDFFVRKVKLAGDFEDFPEPWFWRELRENPEWTQLTHGPTYRGLDGQGELTHTFEEIRAKVEEIRAQSKGQLDVLRDVIGGELQIAGLLPQKSAGQPPQELWCAYARVTWRTRFGYGLLRYGFAQEQLRQGGVQLAPDGELFKLLLSGSPEPLWLARCLDCVMLGNDRELVQRSWELASGIGDPDSFGASANYRDGIERRLAEWEQKTEVPANALEFFFRPAKVFALPSVKFDDNWPDPAHPSDMNQRVLASFINTNSWLGASGALLFEEGSASLLANIELNQNEHTEFQSRFFMTESQERSKWLDPFFSMVPSDVCAAAAMRMPPGEFLREMYTALADAEKSLLDEALKKTGKYGGALDLIKQLEPAFLPRTGFAFRKNVPDPDIPVAAPSPMPQFAWVFWLRDGGETIVSDFVKTVTTYREVMEFAGAYDLPLGLGGTGVGGDAAREFTHPQIPATGSIATLIYKPFFVLSNSGPFIRDLMRTRFNRRESVRQRRDFQEYSEELPGAVNAFIYVQAEELEKVLLDYRNDIRSMATLPDAAWASTNRPTVEANVFRSRYAQQYGSIPALPPEAKAQFEREIDDEMRKLWESQRTGYTAGAEAKIVETISLLRLFSSAYVQMVLEPRYLRMTGRAIARFK